MDRRPTIVLGAGLAGLSLARALVRERRDARVVVVDRRTSWERDRTWCFWAVPGLPFAELATASWESWRTVGARGAFAQRSARHRYLHLPADRFYEAVLAELAVAPGVSIVPGTRVLDVHEDGRGGVVVETSAGTLDGAVAVDAMGGRGPLLAGRPDGAVELRQRFLGLEVETERPIFDPGMATLMDFRVPAVPGAVRFAYVLPFSRTRALVEDTTLGPRGLHLAAADREDVVRGYLDGILGAGAVREVRRESGSLPMTTHAFPAARSRRLVAAGQAAGAGRPSSGYAFARTQRHALALAGALAAGAPPPRMVGEARHRALDALFLRALARDPAAAPAWFEAMAARVPAGAFARFMSDASTPADEARVVAALARPGFLAAMAPRPPGRRPHARPRARTAA